MEYETITVEVTTEDLDSAAEELTLGARVVWLSLEGVDVVLKLPEERIEPHPRVWPNYIDNPWPED